MASSPTEVPLMEDLATFDVAVAVGPYKGRVKLKRLLHVASPPPSVVEKCRSLWEPAIEIVLQTIRTIHDVPLYMKTLAFLKEHCTHEEKPDRAWSANAQVLGLAQTTELTEQLIKLHAQYKGKGKAPKMSSFYKTNLKLGDEYASMGETSTALRHYKSSADPESGQMIAKQWLRIIEMYIDHDAVSLKTEFVDIEKIMKEGQKELKKASAAIGKMNDAQAQRIAVNFWNQAESALNLALALIHLAKSEYDSAARLFFACSADYGVHLYHLVAPMELTLYTTLCSLTVRQEGTSYCDILEIEVIKPCLARATCLEKLVRDVQRADVRAVVNGLTTLADRLIMDPYLSKHVQNITQLIADSALLGLLRQSKTVSIHDIAAQTDIPPAWIESTFHRYVDGKLLKGRIDQDRAVLLLR